MWERKNGSEEHEMKLAAQRTLEGWRAAGEPVDEVEIELALVPAPKQERPTAEMPPKPADRITSAGTSKASLTPVSRKDGLETKTDLYIDKLTLQAFSLLGS